MDEQAVLPQGRVVRRELLVPADERAEQRVFSSSSLDASRRRAPAASAHPGLADDHRAGDVEVEQHRLGLAHALVRSASNAVGIEAAQVGETPRLLGCVGTGSAW